EPLTLQLELEIALLVAGPQSRYRISIRGDGVVGAAVPEHHRPSAVLALGDRPLELAVVDRMVLDFHRQALDGRIDARALRHGPALHDAVQLQPEIVVQPAGVVLLDDVAKLLP